MTEHALDRREAVARLLVDRGDLLVVTGLGSPSYDVMAAGDDELNFYLWAAMGSAAMVGLGLATSQPQRSVLVVTGDGEMLMGLGSLATIAVVHPANLTIAVIDNGHYGETGMQESHTGRGVDLHRIAASAGFAWSETVHDLEGVDELRGRLHSQAGPQFATIKVGVGEMPRVLPNRDGVYIKNRFRDALGHVPL